MLLDPRHRPPVIAAPDRAARRFCVAVVLWAAMAWTALAVLNFIVNPYAQYPTRLVPPQVQISRAQKLQLLDQLQPAPEGLILGSSRVMKLEPDYLRACTGYTFFNAGVNHGKPEDALAWVRYYEHHLGHAPRMVVLGLDVTALADDPPVDARFLNLPALAKQVPEALRLRDRWRRWRELLSWQQTRASVESLCRLGRRSHPSGVDESYRADGLLIYHLREQQIREGGYDLAAAIQDNQREYHQLYAGYQELSSWRCQMLESLMVWCRERGARLVIFITPLHPQLAASLQADTTYEDRKRELVEWLRPLAEHRSCQFHDLSQIAAFAGDAQAFVDGIHPLEKNTRRMIVRIVGGRQSVPHTSSQGKRMNQRAFQNLPLPLEERRGEGFLRGSHRSPNLSSLGERIDEMRTDEDSVGF